MTTSIRNTGSFFYRTFVAVAIGTPMLLTVAASLLPEGPARGEFVLTGLGMVLAAMAAALVLRAAYISGFSSALESAASGTNGALTA